MHWIVPRIQGKLSLIQKIRATVSHPRSSNLAWVKCCEAGDSVKGQTKKDTAARAERQFYPIAADNQITNSITNEHFNLLITPSSFSLNQLSAIMSDVNFFIVESPDKFKELLSADLKRISIINFWAPWAEPCREMNKVVQELAKKYPAALFLQVCIQ